MKSVTGSEKAFTLYDLLLEPFLAFFYFLKGDCHAMQEKQLQC